jgi:photosystem II stability/assembly factor-like uncharacterized protein
LAGAPALADQDVLDRPAISIERTQTPVLLAVTRANERLFAVGEHGVILRSDDGGNTWEQAQVPVSVTLTGVHFATPEKGWAVGHSGVVLHTEDGGRTWIKQLDGRETSRQEPNGETDSTRRDGGVALLPDSPDQPLLDVYFADENRGLVVGAYGRMWATRDGGKTWLAWDHHLSNPTGRHLNCVRAVGSDLYVAGEQGALYRSRDGGETFVEVATPYRGTYFGVSPGAGGRVFVYGLRGNAYWSGDSGRHWRKVDTGAPVTLTAGLVLADGSFVLLSQAGEVLLTRDQGRSFRTLPVDNPSPLTGAVQAPDGRLVLSGARGIRMVAVPPENHGTGP